jgi:hypothetical protein
LETTEITPRPPSAINGSVMASSPESTAKSWGTAWKICDIWEMLPEASLTATTRSSWARRARVAGSTFKPVRPGTL